MELGGGKLLLSSERERLPQRVLTQRQRVLATRFHLDKIRNQIKLSVLGEARRPAAWGCG